MINKCAHQSHVNYFVMILNMFQVNTKMYVKDGLTYSSSAASGLNVLPIHLPEVNGIQLRLKLQFSTNVWWTSIRAGLKFNIKFDITYSTENVLYVLTCMGCNEYYVGQTSNVLMERNRLHKQVLHPDIATCSASRHIDRCASHICLFPTRSCPFSK